MAAKTTTLLTVAMLNLVTTVGAAPLPIQSHQRAEIFAICAGRYAALATNQRGKQLKSASASERFKSDFETLLEAILPDAMRNGVPEGQANRWWSQRWSEMAAHLADMQYSFDTGLVERAQRAVDHRIDECRELILPRSVAG